MTADHDLHDDGEEIRYWQELGQEQERLYTDALDRCLAAGANPDDVRALAAGLGIDYRPMPWMARAINEMFKVGIGSK